MNPVDLLVVGGGTAGIVAAKTAALLGADVLLVERDEPGGDCLWTGCVPSKALLAAADAAATARDANRFGIAATVTGVDFTAVMGHVKHAIAQIAPTDSPDALRAAGVHVRKGTARFTSPTTVDVDGEQVRFARAVIATGASPAVPNVPGLADAAPLTSDTIWARTEPPTRLAILGGGGIGCELGQGFARLGAEVTIVEGADRLLPREDPRAADEVTAALAADGVKVVTGSTVTQVSGSSGDGGTLHMNDGSRVEFDQLLVAVGRRPNTASLALPAATVQTDARGFITVDDRLRTSNRRIWAAGDLTGHPQFTHVAGVHGSVAASNAVLGLRRKVSTTTVPRVTFTSPEVAAVGVGTGSPPRGLQVLHWGNEHVDRAVAESATNGFTRVVIDHRGRILGATVVGPRAGEVLAELTLAVTRGLRARDLAGVTHPYPTYGDGPWNAAIGEVQARLTRPPAAGVIGVLRRWRR